MTFDWPPLEVVAILYPNSGGLAPWRIECTVDIFEGMSVALHKTHDANLALGTVLVSLCQSIELEEGER
jgi:hypothetical protein